MYKIYKIGLLGYGNIGHGVKIVLDELSKTMPLALVKIYDIKAKEEELGKLYCHSVDEITDNKEIDIVIEALGGETFPFEATKRALKAHKHVITSNKEIVSNHLKELLSLAHNNGVTFQFEASCGAGIPIIRPIVEITKSDKIESISGIVNSTTNLILTKTQLEHCSIKEGVKVAQDKGFAENDYQTDLLGYDAIRKIAILSSIAYSTPIDVTLIKRRGLETLEDYMIEALNKNNYYLKYIAESYLENNVVHIGVEPVAISYDHHLMGVKNEENTFILKLKYADTLEFSGKGAGSLPASSSIANDVIRVVENQGYIPNVDRNHYAIEELGDENSKYCIFINKELKIVTKDELTKLNPDFIARIM